jgi:hypothetical protein
MGRECSTHKAKRNAYRFLAEKERSLSALRRRWNDNIKLDLTEIDNGPSGYIRC